MIKIHTTATDEEIAVITAAVSALEAETIKEAKPEVMKWQLYSRRSRYEPATWENKQDNSAWALESRYF